MLNKAMTITAALLLIPSVLVILDSFNALSSKDPVILMQNQDIYLSQSETHISEGESS